MLLLFYYYHSKLKQSANVWVPCVKVTLTHTNNGRSKWDQIPHKECLFHD